MLPGLQPVPGTSAEIVMDEPFGILTYGILEYRFQTIVIGLLARNKGISTGPGTSPRPKRRILTAMLVQRDPCMLFPG